MQEISLREIAVVKQPPEIEEWMESVSAEVSKKVQRAVNLVCTQETVKEVKQVRADLNKEFSEWEANRKRVREAVMAPYEAFNEKYNEYIANQYKEADTALRDKIGEVESALKAEKEADARAYFAELAAVKHLEWLDYDRLAVKITLSRSGKNIRDEIEQRLTAIAESVGMIEKLPDSEEVFAEYQRTLNLPAAMQTVSARKEAIEANRKRQEEMQARLQAEKEAAAKVEAAATPEPPATLEPPKEEPAQVEENPKKAGKISSMIQKECQRHSLVELCGEWGVSTEDFYEFLDAGEQVYRAKHSGNKNAEKYRVSFAVIGTMDELRALKAFLENGGYEYECE